MLDKYQKNKSKFLKMVSSIVLSSMILQGNLTTYAAIVSSANQKRVEVIENTLKNPEKKTDPKKTYENKSPFIKFGIPIIGGATALFTAAGVIAFLLLKKKDFETIVSKTYDKMNEYKSETDRAKASSLLEDFIDFYHEMSKNVKENNKNVTVDENVLDKIKKINTFAFNEEQLNVNGKTITEKEIEEVASYLVLMQKNQNNGNGSSTSDFTVTTNSQSVTPRGNQTPTGDPKNIGNNSRIIDPEKRSSDENDEDKKRKEKEEEDRKNKEKEEEEKKRKLKEQEEHDKEDNKRNKEKEAKKIELIGELDIIESSLKPYISDDLNGKINKIREELSSSGADFDAINKEIVELRKEVSSFKEEEDRKNKEKEEEEKKRKLKEQEEENRKIELIKKLDTIESSLKPYMSDDLKGKINKIREELSSSGADFDAIDKKMDELRDNFKEKMEEENKKKELIEKLSNINSKLYESDDLKNEISKLNEMLTQKGADFDTIDKGIDNLKEILHAFEKGMEEGINKSKEKFSEIEKEINLNEKLRGEFSKEVSEINEKINEIKNEENLDKVLERLESLNSKIEEKKIDIGKLLEELTQNYDSLSIKLKEAKNKKKFNEDFFKKIDDEASEISSFLFSHPNESIITEDEKDQIIDLKNKIPSLCVEIDNMVSYLDYLEYRKKFFLSTIKEEIREIDSQTQIINLEFKNLSDLTLKNEYDYIVNGLSQINSQLDNFEQEKKIYDDTIDKLDKLLTETKMLLERSKTLYSNSLKSELTKLTSEIRSKLVNCDEKTKEFFLNNEKIKEICEENEGNFEKVLEFYDSLLPSSLKKSDIKYFEEIKYIFSKEEKRAKKAKKMLMENECKILYNNLENEKNNINNLLSNAGTYIFIVSKMPFSTIDPDENYLNTLKSFVEVYKREKKLAELCVYLKKTKDKIDFAKSNYNDEKINECSLKFESLVKGILVLGGKIRNDISIKNIEIKKGEIDDIDEKLTVRLKEIMNFKEKEKLEINNLKSQIDEKVILCEELSKKFDELAGMTERSSVVDQYNHYELPKKTKELKKTVDEKFENLKSKINDNIKKEELESKLKELKKICKFYEQLYCYFEYLVFYIFQYEFSRKEVVISQILIEEFEKLNKSSNEDFNEEWDGKIKDMSSSFFSNNSKSSIMLNFNSFENIFSAVCKEFEEIENMYKNYKDRKTVDFSNSTVNDISSINVDDFKKNILLSLQADISDFSSKTKKMKIYEKFDELLYLEKFNVEKVNNYIEFIKKAKELLKNDLFFSNFGNNFLNKFIIKKHDIKCFSSDNIFNISMHSFVEIVSSKKLSLKHLNTFSSLGINYSPPFNENINFNNNQEVLNCFKKFYEFDELFKLVNDNSIAKYKVLVETQIKINKGTINADTSKIGDLCKEIRKKIKIIEIFDNAYDKNSKKDFSSILCLFCCLSKILFSASEVYDLFSFLKNHDTTPFIYEISLFNMFKNFLNNLMNISEDESLESFIINFAEKMFNNHPSEISIEQNNKYCDLEYNLCDFYKILLDLVAKNFNSFKPKKRINLFKNKNFLSIVEGIEEFNPNDFSNSTCSFSNSNIRNTLFLNLCHYFYYIFDSKDLIHMNEFMHDPTVLKEK